MATSKTPPAKLTAPELQAAATLVLDKEKKRQRRATRRAERQKRQREKEQLAAVQRMQQSIEVMKWCIVIIATIMLGGVVVAVWTLSNVRAEVEKVQPKIDAIFAEVEKVRPDVERVINEVNEVVDGVEKVREALRNPMQSIGSAFGAELDAKLQDFVGKKLGTGE